MMGAATRQNGTLIAANNARFRIQPAAPRGYLRSRRKTSVDSIPQGRYQEAHAIKPSSDSRLGPAFRREADTARRSGRR